MWEPIWYLGQRAKAPKEIHVAKGMMDGVCTLMRRQVYFLDPDGKGRQRTGRFPEALYHQDTQEEHQPTD
jgi:hypothetical protein